jgi:thiamine-phosphate pyrophosphorylase
MGADSIAVVSDVTQNADPDARVRAWLSLTSHQSRKIA